MKISNEQQAFLEKLTELAEREIRKHGNTPQPDFPEFTITLTIRKCPAKSTHLTNGGDLPIPPLHCYTLPNGICVCVKI